MKSAFDPKYVTDREKSFRYLYNLQKSGRTNMYGAGAYLEAERGLNRTEARDILLYYMTHYSEIATLLGIEA